MASTYSNLKIQLMATGENSGTWGNVTNLNLGTAIEQAMVETADITFASATVTLSLTDTNSAQDARALRLNLTGTSGGAQDLVVPAIQKPYIVNNGTADTITIKVSGQTGVAVPAGKTMLVYNNGTDVVDAISHLSALSLGTALPITSGGTGTNVTTYANLESNVTGTLPVANGGTGITSFGTGVGTALGQAVTGSGGIALETSPTFVTPVLGTPTSGTLSNCTVDGTDAVGFRNVPQNSQSADYTLVLADAGKHIFHPSADNNARTFTIPADSSVAYPVGTAITFINMAVANVTIAITSDTLTLSAAGTTGSRTLATNGSATCIKIASTQWLISGSGLT